MLESAIEKAIGHAVEIKGKEQFLIHNKKKLYYIMQKELLMHLWVDFMISMINVGSKRQDTELFLKYVSHSIANSEYFVQKLVNEINELATDTFKTILGKFTQDISHYKVSMIHIIASPLLPVWLALLTDNNYFTGRVLRALAMT